MLTPLQALPMMIQLKGEIQLSHTGDLTSSGLPTYTKLVLLLLLVTHLAFACEKQVLPCKFARLGWK